MPDQILNFDALYAANCAGCHGASGKLGPAPPLNDPLFVAIIPKDLLLSVVQGGRAGTPMPPFSKQHGGPLTANQIKVLVDGIRANWKAETPTTESLPTYAITTVEGDPDSAGNRERGAEVFSLACAECHGVNGAGIEIDCTVANSINVPSFLALISDQAIRRIIITGRPDLGMPTFSENNGRADNFQPLTPSEIDDLVALVGGWRTAAEKFSHSSP